MRIYVPELVQQHQQAVAQVGLDRQGIRQATQMVEVAKTKIETAKAEESEAVANVQKFEAEIARWVFRALRDLKMVAERALDKQVADETLKTLDSSTARPNAALEAVKARKAAKESAEADWERRRST